MPSSLIYKAIRTKKIKVNRKRAEPSYKLSLGDKVLMFISEDFFKDSAGEDSFKNIVPKLDIIFEDNNMLLVNKRAGISCIPDDHEDLNTLINHIKAYLYKKGEYNPDLENSFAPSLCNRIDRNTCGIVIAAKNAETLRYLNDKIKSGKVRKKYLCIVHGVPNQNRAELHGYLIKDAKTNTVTVYKDYPGITGAKKIGTVYKVVERGKNYSLLEIELLTGRTHQIRAHMASIGHPLFGDGKYGINRDDRRLGYKYQALCSYSTTIDGKEYVIPKEDIWFVSDFEKIKKI